MVDIPLQSEQRLSISGLPSNNGVPPAGPSSRKDKDPMAASWPSGVAVNGNTPAIHLGKPLPGRDPKSRARSRDYLKQSVFSFYSRCATHSLLDASKKSITLPRPPQ